MSLVHAFPLAQTAKALRTGRVTALETVHLACDRADALDETIQALLPDPERRARLVLRARELARDHPVPNRRPPLYGVVFGVKDIFHVEGLVTAAGSELPPEELAGEQGSCVTALLEAGALFLGKTRTTEFAWMEPGPTANPYDPGRTPGGSSSGSAAAVSAGMCPLALGTQTIGSIIRPAAYCGIVGFKPSHARIGTDGVLPFSRTVDDVGLFTQDVAGMSLAAAVVCADWQTPSDPGLPVLGIPVGPYLNRAPFNTRRAFEAQTDFLRDLDWPIVFVNLLEDIEQINHRHRRLVAAEFAAVHEHLFSNHADLYRPRTRDLIYEGQTVSADELQAAREGCLQLREQLLGTMQAEGVDAWISPSAMGPADEGLKTTGNPDMSLPWTHAGLPAVSVPIALTRDGLPLGLQMVAGWMADERLLAWAAKVSEDISPQLY